MSKRKLPPNVPKPAGPSYSLTRFLGVANRIADFPSQIWKKQNSAEEFGEISQKLYQELQAAHPQALVDWRNSPLIVKVSDSCDNLKKVCENILTWSNRWHRKPEQGEELLPELIVRWRDAFEAVAGLRFGIREIEQSHNGDVFPTKTPKTKVKRRGAPRLYDEKNDNRLCQDWKAAKGQGTTREVFTRDKGLSVNDLIAAMHRVKYRRIRDAE